MTAQRRLRPSVTGIKLHPKRRDPGPSFDITARASVSLLRRDALKVVESLKARGVNLHLLDLGGDIAGNGISKLFLTIAAAFPEAERDRIRERIGQVKADQKAHGRYLGGKVPFGFRRGGDGELVPHEAEQEAIREMVALRAQGRPLRAIADAVAAKGASGSATRAWRAC